MIEPLGIRREIHSHGQFTTWVSKGDSRSSADLANRLTRVLANISKGINTGSRPKESEARLGN